MNDISNFGNRLVTLCKFIMSLVDSVYVYIYYTSYQVTKLLYYIVYRGITKKGLKIFLYKALKVGNFGNLVTRLIYKYRVTLLTGYQTVTKGFFGGNQNVE